MDAPSPHMAFTTGRAQRWVLGAAIVVAMSYMLRRLVEPTVNAVPSKGTKAARLAGHGSPPPTLAHWATAYGTGFTLLSLLTLGAPELAGALAVLVVAGTVLANGKGLADDLLSLEGGGSSSTPEPTQAGAMAQARQANANWERQHGLPVILGATP